MSDSDKPVTHSELNLMIGPLLDRQSEQLEVSKETNKSLQELALSIRDLASEKKHLEKEVENVKTDVSSIKKQFFSTWEWSAKLRDGMFKWIIPIICSGVFLSAAAALGYVKVGS
jgi:septal ring factor EnvC (AmiA/AmiB activator)